MIGMTELIDAVKAGDGEQVARMLNADASLLSSRDANGVSAILLAMYHGKAAIAQLFIDRGAPLDLHEAAATGQLERVRELAPASDINAAGADGFQPLGLACYFGHEEVARFLIGAGAGVTLASKNTMQVQPIHAATARRSVSIVRLLLENGADPDAQQQMGYTPMDSAMQNGDHEIIELLKAHGARGRAATGQ
jgi:ankyrin repeat protein